MAQIVLGIGTSHGPMLSTPPDQWGARVPSDRENPRHWYRGRTYTFDELAELRAAENLGAQAVPEVWAVRHAACRAAIDQLAGIFARSRVDVAVIVGNDQMEIFTEASIPALAVWRDARIPNMFPGADELAQLPLGIPESVPGHVPPEGAVNPGHPELAERIIRQAVAEGFDPAVLGALAPGASSHISHAVGFVFRQVMKDRPVPSVPVLLNTFYPPNQPAARRCYELGGPIVRAISSWDSDTRVALVCSGGLSHFVIDEALDRTILTAIETGKADDLTTLDENFFQAGSSEIKNWLPVAGVMAELDYQPAIVDYVPCYRSEAGTGNAMGFVYWTPRA